MKWIYKKQIDKNTALKTTKQLMNEWTGGWMKERMNEWMNEMTLNEWMKLIDWMIEWPNKWMNLI